MHIGAIIVELSLGHICHWIMFSQAKRGISAALIILVEALPEKKWSVNEKKSYQDWLPRGPTLKKIPKLNLKKNASLCSLINYLLLVNLTYYLI